jgi:hypothetical protein
MPLARHPAPGPQALLKVASVVAVTGSVCEQAYQLGDRLFLTGILCYHKLVERQRHNGVYFGYN